MKILMVSSYLPYPLFSGGQIRLFNLIKHLSKENEITLICEKRKNQNVSDINEVKKYCKGVYTVDRKKQWSVSNVLKSGLSKNPFLITGHKLSEMRNIISRELESNNFDIIHVETSYVFQNLPQTNLPIILNEHNIEYLVYERFAKKAFLPIRPLLNLDIAKLKRIEESFWKKADRIVTVSEIEKKIIGGNNVDVVPNGVDLTKFKLKKINFNEDEKIILFIGDFKWIQNRDSLKFILDEIWPKLTGLALENETKLKLWVVGKNLPESFKKHTDKTTFFDTTNSMSTEEIFSKSYILLAPIQVGGGTSYKILESMAIGTPVVTTSLGIEGLDVKSERDILIAKTPAEFSTQILSLISEKDKYLKFSKNGREAVERSYEWGSVTEKLMNVYKKAVNEQSKKS